MLTWLNSRSPGGRKAARAASPPAVPRPRVTPLPPDEDDLRPPFFADSDPAFLDLGDDAPAPPPAPAAAVVEPPPLPVPAPPRVEARIGESVEARLARLVLDLPAFPDRTRSDRTRELLAIYRQLDRIAAEAARDDA